MIQKLRLPSIRQVGRIAAIGCVGIFGGYQTMHYLNQQNETGLRKLLVTHKCKIPNVSKTGITG